MQLYDQPHDPNDLPDLPRQTAVDDIDKEPTETSNQTAANTEAIKSLKEAIKAVKSDVRHLHNSYFGNGKTGLRTWVTVLVTINFVQVLVFLKWLYSL